MICDKCKSETNYYEYVESIDDSMYMCYICSGKSDNIIMDNIIKNKYKITDKILNKCSKFYLKTPNKKRYIFYERKQVFDTYEKYIINEIHNDLLEAKKIIDDEKKEYESYKKNVINILNNLLVKHDEKYIQFYSKKINNIGNITNMAFSCNDVAILLCSQIDNDIYKNKHKFDNKIKRINTIQKYCKENNLDFDIVKKVPYMNTYINDRLTLKQIIQYTTEYVITKCKIRSFAYDYDIYDDSIVYDDINNDRFDDTCQQCKCNSSWFCIIKNVCFECCNDCCKGKLISYNELKKYKLYSSENPFYRNNVAYYWKINLVAMCNITINKQYNNKKIIQRHKEFLANVLKN